ncbi:phosphoribosylformylglycinamidine synthase I [Candidatus Pacearchaeota archaeon]|nr:phosphoribosylformylglycinamidine synthase I [Candidatus Pacearchaeota archaeon]
MKPRVLILSGYGINCERETKFAFELVGADAEIVHVNDLISGEKNLEDYQILAFPGGFSYGDDTGSGNAMANKIRLNLWNEVVGFINSGKLVIGICNGFQVLTNLGLLPALEKKYGKREVALTFNNSARYECRWVHLKNKSKKCIFTKNIDGMHIPVAHGEGKFYTDENTLRSLYNNDQIVFTYALSSGEPAKGVFPYNPNGALQDIAGICDETGRILGMMPHPERAIFTSNSPIFQKEKEKLKRQRMEIPEVYEPARRIFQNAVDYVIAHPELVRNKNLTYADSGVNIELGDSSSKILYNAAKLTWQNRKGLLGEVIIPFDDFSGLRLIDVSRLPLGTMMCLGFDGIGTKVEIAERMNNHSTMAYDLLAMVCDDAVLRGGEPVLVGSVLDVNSLGFDKNNIEKVKQLANGYIGAAKEANVAVINGELAELSGRVGGYGNFNYNWGAGLVWFAKKERLFTGYEIKVGDKIIALKENGFRSNGLSLVRKVFKQTYGDDWHNVECDNSTLGNLVLTPSKIYCKAIVNIHGGVFNEQRAIIHGVVHVTGGGIPGKLGRVLRPSKLGAQLTDLFEPPNIMSLCQKLGNISDEESYRSWNMGNGMLIITPESEKVIRLLSEFGIEAKVAGEIIKEPEIRIKSKGIKRQGEYLPYVRVD